MNPNQVSILERAEEDAYVQEQLDEAGVAPRRSLNEIRRELESAQSALGGLTSTAESLDIYNRYDGTKSTITSDQAKQRLRVRFGRDHPWAGELVWAVRPPEHAPPVGQLLCPLHADSEQRAYLSTLGFQNQGCRKDTMRTEEDVERHFEQVHPRVHRAVERDKERQLEKQRMDLMREQTDALLSMSRRTEGGEDRRRRTKREEE